MPVLWHRRIFIGLAHSPEASLSRSGEGHDTFGDRGFVKVLVEARQRTVLPQRKRQWLASKMLTRWARTCAMTSQSSISIGQTMG